MYILEFVSNHNIIIIVALVAFLVVVLSINSIKKNRKSSTGSVKLNTTSEFYHIVSQFGADLERDQMIVYSKNPDLQEQKMIIDKNALGMTASIFDKHDTLLVVKEKISVNDVALIFHKMWQSKPKQYTNYKNKPIKKKDPIIFK